jgi:putative intracellular protease/amidase
MKKVLMVLTSHDTLGNTGNKTGIWLEELAGPYYKFVDNNVDVTLASPAGRKPPIDPKSSISEMQTDSTRRFEKDPVAQKVFKNTIPLSKVKVEDYDAVFYPGGHGPMWDLSTDQTNARLAGKFHMTGKPIGAVCHGPAGLVRAVDEEGISILKDRKVTGFSNTEEIGVGLDKVVPFLLEDRLRELGGRYSRGPDWASYVVVDGLLVTGQNPASAVETAGALISLLIKRKRPAEASRSKQHGI